MLYLQIFIQSLRNFVAVIGTFYNYSIWRI